MSQWWSFLKERRGASHQPADWGKGKDLREAMKGLCMDSHMSVLAQGPPSLQAVGLGVCGERGRQLCPGGGQKDVVWGGQVTPELQEVSPGQLLPEGGVRGTTSALLLANVTRLHPKPGHRASLYLPLSSLSPVGCRWKKSDLVTAD